MISGFERSDDSMPSSTGCGTKSLDTPNQQTNKRVVLYSSLNKTIWPKKRKDKRMNTEGQVYSTSCSRFYADQLEITCRSNILASFAPSRSQGGYPFV